MKQSKFAEYLDNDIRSLDGFNADGYVEQSKEVQDLIRPSVRRLLLSGCIASSCIQAPKTRKRRASELKGMLRARFNSIIDSLQAIDHGEVLQWASIDVGSAP